MGLNLGLLREVELSLIDRHGFNIIHYFKYQFKKMTLKCQTAG